MTSGATANLPETNAANKNLEGYFRLDSTRNSKGTGWPYLETVWKDRIDEPRINYHTSFHAWLESSVAGKVDRDALESLMKADSISSISSPDRSVMVVSVLRIYDICRKWRCTGVNRLKADQSFRVDEMKVQTRSPCERTVDEKRERKKGKESIWYADRCSRKNCDFFLSQRRDTCGERRKKKHAYLSLRSRFYVSSESERVNCWNTFNNRINREEEKWRMEKKGERYC